MRVHSGSSTFIAVVLRAIDKQVKGIIPVKQKQAGKQGATKEVILMQNGGLGNGH